MKLIDSSQWADLIAETAVHMVDAQEADLQPDAVQQMSQWYMAGKVTRLALDIDFGVVDFPVEKGFSQQIELREDVSIVTTDPGAERYYVADPIEGVASHLMVHGLQSASWPFEETIAWGDQRLDPLIQAMRSAQARQPRY